jgi:hypothetical protein
MNRNLMLAQLRGSGLPAQRPCLRVDRHPRRCILQTPNRAIAIGIAACQIVLILAVNRRHKIGHGCDDGWVVEQAITIRFAVIIAIAMLLKFRHV